MRLEVYIVEDAPLLNEDFESAKRHLNHTLRLEAKGIELHFREFKQIEDINDLNAACSELLKSSTSPRVVIADLDLTTNGIQLSEIEEQFTSIFNKNKIEPPRLDLEAYKWGGLSAITHALQSGSKRQALTVASNTSSPIYIEDDIKAIFDALKMHAPFKALKGGLDKDRRRNQLFEEAIAFWIDSHYAARSRIWPSYAKSWFANKHDVVPHDFNEQLGLSESYKEAICDYLSLALQINESKLKEKYVSLDCKKKGLLHDYLKGIVGEYSFVHAGGDRHLMWNHLPFIAACCAPGFASSLWALTGDHICNLDRDILTPNHHEKEGELIDYLVGTEDSANLGIFNQLLKCENQNKSSNLVSTTFNKNAFTITLGYDINRGRNGRKSLFSKFEHYKEEEEILAGESSGALCRADSYFCSVGLRIELDAASNLLTIKEV